MTNILSAGISYDFLSVPIITDKISPYFYRTSHSAVTQEIYNNNEPKAYTCSNSYSLAEIKDLRTILVKIIHYTCKGEYLTSQIQYRYGYSQRILYANIRDLEEPTSSLIKNTFDLNKTSYKGAPIEIIEYKERKWKLCLKGSVKSYMKGDLTLSFPEPHYSIDVEDKEFFRMRSCIYDISLFPSNIKWTQNFNRPCYFLNNIEVTSSTFDSNSLQVFLNQKVISDNLSKLIIEYNGTKDRVIQKERSAGSVNNSLKTKVLTDFVNMLFDCTIKLFYINTSYDWSWSDLNYELFWNLAMYVMQTVKPFKDGVDWMERLKTEYLKYKVCKKLYNEAQKGLDKYLREHTYTKVGEKSERYRFPKVMKKSDREAFKLKYKSTKQKEIEDKEVLSEKNKTHKKEDKAKLKKSVVKYRNKGMKLKEISEETGYSITTIKRILKEVK